MIATAKDQSIEFDLTDIPSSQHEFFKMVAQQDYEREQIRESFKRTSDTFQIGSERT